MQRFEKLGAFYLGQEYDLAAGKRLDRLLMYDARDLTTHAICVGMTGSGKTGLCIDLLEEAAIDSVPAIIVDPKGDLTNLLLTFPNLRPEDFEPWVNVDDARRKDMSVSEYAAHIADKWEDAVGEIETYAINPRRKDVQVEVVALAWTPYWEIGYRSARGKLTHERVPAWR